MTPCVFVLLLMLLMSAHPTSAQSRPRAPGIRQADQAEAQTEKNIPPPIQQHTAVDLAKLGQEADELARIARTIPPDIASVQKGMLPRNVIQKLKEIEKLSKHLRNELTR